MGKQAGKGFGKWFKRAKNMVKNMGSGQQCEGTFRGQNGQRGKPQGGRGWGAIAAQLAPIAIDLLKG